MSGLKETARRLAREAPLPLPPAERLLAVERVAAGLALRRTDGGGRLRGA